jgi:hypothetical protein
MYNEILEQAQMHPPGPVRLFVMLCYWTAVSEKADETRRSMS